MTETGKRRLLRLAEFLDSLPPEKFDLAYWGDQSSPCGTVACACGWACLLPEFQAEGLKVNIYTEDEKRYATGTFAPVYGSNRGVEAMMEFFDISSDDFDDLFLDDSYPEYDRGGKTPPSDVAERIRHFVSREE